MAEKVELVINKEENDKGGLKPIFLHEKYHQMLADMKNETGVSMTKLMERYIAFGIDHTTIKDG